MGGHYWKHCYQCEEEKAVYKYHPVIALYVRPPGKKRWLEWDGFLGVATLK